MLRRFWRFFERHHVILGGAAMVVAFGAIAAMLWNGARVNAREEAARQAWWARISAYSDAQKTGQSVIPAPKTWSDVGSLAKEKQQADQDAKSEPPAPGQPGDWQPMNVAFQMSSTGSSPQTAHPWYIQRVQAMNLTHHVLTSISFPVLKGAINVVQASNDSNVAKHSLKVDADGYVTAKTSIQPLSTATVDVAYDLPSPGMLPWHFSWTTPFAIPVGVGVAIYQGASMLILAPSDQFARQSDRDGPSWRVWATQPHVPAGTTLSWTVVWDPSVPVPPENLAKPPSPPTPHSYIGQ